MTVEEVRHIESLVIAYEKAYSERMTVTTSEPRKLWASRPLQSEYRAVAEAVRAAAVRPRHSDTFVEEYVDELLQRALDNPNAIADHVQQLKAQLEHAVTTRIYVPLDGINIEGDELLIGHVRLVRMNDAAYETLIVDPFSHIMDLNPNYNDVAAAQWVARHRERLTPLRGRTCIEITTDLDLEASAEPAQAIVDDVCDFLQLCLATVASREVRNPVRMSSGVFQGWSLSFGISDGPNPRSNSGAELTYGGHSPTLGTASVDKLKECGLFELGAHLGVAPATEYGALLRRAVRWFAKGEREPHPDDRKLAYVTAIDLFFQQPPGRSPDRRGVVRRFCDGVGLALENDPAVAAQVARSVHRFYASRSETSHAGRVDVETDESVNQLRWTLLNLLSVMSGKPFSTKADVNDWIAGRLAELTTEEQRRMHEAAQR